jgi:hypothetical protein
MKRDTKPKYSYIPLILRISFIFCFGVIFMTVSSASFAQEEEKNETDVWGTPFQFSIWNPVQLFPDDWNVYGLRMNVFYGKNQDVYGLDMGILANRAKNLTGIQIAGFGNKAFESLRGIQFAGIGNNCPNADIYGIQMGFGNRAKNLTGIQFGAGSEALTLSRGIQIGGLYTKTDEMKGVQTGFFNIIEKGLGFQFGVFNIATKISGLQIGLINIIQNGFIPVFPIINFSMSNVDDIPSEQE